MILCVFRCQLVVVNGLLWVVAVLQQTTDHEPHPTTYTPKTVPQLKNGLRNRSTNIKKGVLFGGGHSLFDIGQLSDFSGQLSASSSMLFYTDS
jgi:hypothetical protein